MKFPFLSFLGVILVSLTCSESAHSAFLSDLIGPPPQTLSSTSSLATGNYTVIGSNWSYSPTGNMPLSTAVTVNAAPDYAGHAGFEIQGAFHSNGGNGSSDALLQYQVSLSPASLAAGLVFSLVNLSSDVTVVGGSTTNIGSISIVETIRDIQGNILGTLTNYDIWTAVGETHLHSDTLVLDPTKHYTTLLISKDILASSDSANAIPQVSHIDQSFGTVPEPASLAMTAIGIAATGFMSYRQRRMKNRP